MNLKYLFYKNYVSNVDELITILIINYIIRISVCLILILLYTKDFALKFIIFIINIER